ncbi:WhiB family transcriptional regulator [Labedaea rhizosphaerae]|uniref:WhiB family redox-sensing transcriptional regulator n=1 Tax=Labedaea rhizosphaerae TaxID=598644 RepID=A0A4R6SE57_LABRH|nr:WhiB family transcriptional regulator [Labedaea rhizosphaerae]TDP97933.1 WhiB family redox-sensing transcriptional regulator [Labedaea rhizosphaerae]
MVTSDDHWRFVGIAWRLDRLRWVPRDVLADVVMKDGECVWAFADGDPPELTGHDGIDRELAARLCARCPVQDECLELELRTAGEHTTGVWGALNERDRRALYPHWRQRGERAEPLDEDGGEEQ